MHCNENMFYIILNIKYKFIMYYIIYEDGTCSISLKKKKINKLGKILY